MAAAARKKTARSLSQILGSVLKQGHIGKKLLEVQAKEIWADVAGNPLSLHSHVDKISKGVLIVRCSHSSWMSELSFYKSDIIKKLNAQLPVKGISDIRFYVGVDEGEGAHEQGA